MNANKAFHLKGMAYLLGALNCFFIAYWLVKNGINDTYWLQSERSFGAFTIAGLIGSIGGAFILAFYFVYVAVLIEMYKVKTVAKYIRRNGK